MKISRKSWIVIASGSIALIVVAALIWQLTVEHMIHKQIRLFGETSMSRDITVEDVDYTIWNNTVVIKNLQVKNPEGYSRNSALSIDKIKIQLAPFALFKRLVHVRSCQVEGVHASIELKKIPTSITDIVELIIFPEFNLMALSGERGNTGETAERSGKKDQHTKNMWFIRIDDFSIRGIKVSSGNLLKFPLPSTFKEINLPDYQISHLGQSGDKDIAGIVNEVYAFHLDQLKKRLSQWWKGMKEKCWQDWIEKIKKSWQEGKETKEEMLQDLEKMEKIILQGGKEKKEKMLQDLEEMKEKISRKTEEAKEKISQKMEEAKEKISQKMEEAKEKIPQKTEEAKEKISQKTEEAKEKIPQVWKGIKKKIPQWKKTL